MSKYLVIVESPAKSKTISKYLGPDFNIKASFGHVRDLPTRKLGVDIDHDFEPTYTPMKDKKKVLSELKSAAKKSELIYIATDPDREGEAIAWHIQHALDLPKEKVRRVVFNEITKSTVTAAVENSRDINQDLVDAQQARRVLDRLIGYKLSPILSKKIRRGLSAGRVQSVAVRILCEKEKLIKAFVPEEYWVIDAEFETKETQCFKAKLVAKNSPSETLHIPNEAASTAILNDLKGASYSVDNIKVKEAKRHPQPPFITSTLQQEASRKLNWSAKKTMIVAQQLYEGIDIDGEPTGLITYMRTDSVRIANDALMACRDIILKKYGNDFLPESARNFKTKKGAQDAHEAIRPTMLTMSPSDMQSNGSLQADQLKLYRLIWDRFLASQMTPAVVENTSVLIKSSSAVPYYFKVSGTVMLFEGFMRVYREGKDHQDGSDTNDELPKLEEHAPLILQDIEGLQKFTQPPHRYTEASLVKELEERGIGRPSTYAPTISTILDRGYVEKDKKTLIPTELGIIVNDQLVAFFDQIIDFDFTAKMETQLDEIMDGKHVWSSVVRDVYHPFEGMLAVADKDMEKVKTDKPTDRSCPNCGQPMVIKMGRFGDFIACSNFPECKTTESIVVKVDVACPECNSDIVQKRSKRGKVFYGCSAYPTCKFAAWDKPIAESCPKCQYPIMVVKPKKGQDDTTLCVKCDIKPYVPKKKAESTKKTTAKKTTRKKTTTKKTTAKKAPKKKST